MRSTEKYVCLTIPVVLLVLVVVLTVSGFVFVNKILTPHSSDFGRNVDDVKTWLSESYPTQAAWLDSLEQCGAIKDTVIVGREDKKLKGYYVKADQSTAHTALLLHGHTDSHWSMFTIGYLYQHVLGYNILLPDFYGHGESEGDSFGMGWDDRGDVLQWVDVAKTLFGDDMEMVIHGVSMGAAATMMVSGSFDVPANVKCYVEDCGYTSVYDEFAYMLKEDYHLPRFPLLAIGNIICDSRFGWNFKEASALAQVAKCRRPMLFIHGGADKYVPTYMVYRLYEAHKGEKAMWVAMESGHAESYHDETEEYTSHVRNFVEQYIPPHAMATTDLLNSSTIVVP